MAIKEQIVTGRFYRTMLDVANKTWQRISFWTKSTDVEFNDGMNAEAKLGAIKGITDSTNVTEKGYAADAKIVSEINNSLGGCVLKQEGNDFYITGADSVSKKLGNNAQKVKAIKVALSSTWGGGSSGTTLTINILYNGDNIVSVTGTASWTSDGPNSARVNDYTIY